MAKQSEGQMWGGPYESTLGDKSSRSLTNHMIFRILYGFFWPFLLLYYSICNIGRKRLMDGTPGPLQWPWRGFAQECSIYKAFQSSGHKIYTMTCRFMPYKACFFREHSLLTFLTKHNMSWVPGQSEEACEAWSAPSQYLRLSTGRKCSVLGMKTNNDHRMLKKLQVTLFECPQWQR